jgi:hypothetical protein
MEDNNTSGFQGLAEEGVIRQHTRVWGFLNDTAMVGSVPLPVCPSSQNAQHERDRS